MASLYRPLVFAVAAADTSSGVILQVALRSLFCLLLSRAATHALLQGGFLAPSNGLASNTAETRLVSGLPRKQ
jgi:hypothetical protein